MECVTLRKRGKQFLSLVVPGLAERRPSLVQGDHIFVKLSSEYGNDTTSTYQVCLYSLVMLYFFVMIMVISFSLYGSNFYL